MFSLSVCAPNACAPTVASWLRASNDRTKHSETLEENYVRQAPAQARSSAASQKRKKREGTLPTLPLLLSSGYICTCSQKVCLRARSHAGGLDSLIQATLLPAGRCTREGCPYLHDPAKVAVCRMFLAGKCDAGDACPLVQDRVAYETVVAILRFLHTGALTGPAPGAHTGLPALSGEHVSARELPISAHQGGGGCSRS